MTIKPESPDSVCNPRGDLGLGRVDEGTDNSLATSCFEEPLWGMIVLLGLELELEDEDAEVGEDGERVRSREWNPAELDECFPRSRERYADEFELVVGGGDEVKAACFDDERELNITPPVGFPC